LEKKGRIGPAGKGARGSRSGRVTGNEGETITPRPDKAGLYVHFPFCRRKCPYCHFASVLLREEGPTVWREGLEREAALRSGSGVEFDTLYIGGGTPSLLGPEDVAGLLELLGRYFPMSLREFTLEANPASETGLPELAGWARAGVTRLSVGVQAFDDRTLQILGRDYTAAGAESFLRRARAAEFRSVGLDLMVGVPGETRASLERTLEAVERTGPDHVSLYLLENVEGLPFEAVLREKAVDEDEAVDDFEFAAARLGRLGFERYEISNFARSGHSCLHNLKYWRYEPFLGLGPSAASHIGSERWSNTAGIEAWAAALKEGADPRAEIVALGPEKSFREALVSGLRLVAGIDLADFRARFGVDLEVRFAPEIGALERDGLIVLRAGVLRIPEDKLLVSNRALAAFV
jgi:oxygen-independent coproporphyrinogen III oxidase